jgi:hypothetical protein
MAKRFEIRDTKRKRAGWLGSHVMKSGTPPSAGAWQRERNVLPHMHVGTSSSRKHTQDEDDTERNAKKRRGKASMR